MSRIDRERLAHWLDDHGVPGAGEVPRLRELGGGASNVVLELTRGGARTVLRRPPWAVPQGRGEAMLREHRILAALRDTAVPHAHVYGACADEAVVGAPFYVMDYVDGWSPAAISGTGWPAPFDADPAARRELAVQLVEALATLADVDWKGGGLADLGRPDGFHDRQVDRWLRQWESAKDRPLHGLEDAARWLRGHRPRRWAPGLMHGDYQFANVLFAHGAPARVAAIVDWELATVGDPLLDLAWVLMSDDWNADQFDLAGMPARDELVALYATRTGRPVDDIDYYLVLARFKMAVVLEAGFARERRNPGSNPGAAGFGSLVLALAERAGAAARAMTASGTT